MKKTKIIGLSLLSLLAASSQAAITYMAISNDADSGISAANTYTHTLDFGNNAAALIGGVQFAAYGSGANGTLNFTYTPGAGGLVSHDGNSNHNVAGGSGLATLLTDMYIGAPPDAGAPGTAILELRNLNPGQQYDLRIYTRQWAGMGTRPATFNFIVDGATTSTNLINQDDATSAGFATSNQAYYISYTYTAGLDGVARVEIAQTQNNQTWHLYGLTNQVIPEPSSLVMLSLGLISVARRKR